MPPYVRGGIWTNVEDEILKAAVSKYGLHQWSRVASLLVRKTDRQCKARWDEFLSPTIVQTPWRAEDDRRLLSLAKVMPNRWRSIAPILGRTAVQCQERYLELITDKPTAIDGDNAEADSQESDQEEDDSLKMLEASAARPDFVDMDDDEQEMLMEARARLANTKGKKAKRKERERYLEQQKRQSVLEERKSAKASGKSALPALKLKSSKFSVDYNAEIPFEIAAPEGAHDTESEKRENKLATRKFGADVAGGTAKTFGKEEKSTKRDQETHAFAEEVAQKRRRLELPPATSASSSSPAHLLDSSQTFAQTVRTQTAPRPLVSVPVETTAVQAVEKPNRRFLDLPVPKNDFELAVPEAPEIPQAPAPAQEADVAIACSVTAENLPLATSVSGKDPLKQEVQALLKDPKVLPATKYNAAKALVDAALELDEPVPQPKDRTLIASAPPSSISRQRVEESLRAKLSQGTHLQQRLEHAYGELAKIDESIAGFASLAEWERAGIHSREAALRQLLSLVNSTLANHP